jgi:DNA-binding SARP family transcriptional activator
MGKHVIAISAPGGPQLAGERTSQSAVSSEWGAPPGPVPIHAPDSAAQPTRRGIPHAVGLPRPRLLAALDRLLSVRLGMVVALPGAGKTTLMAQWARGASVDVAWHTVQPAETGVDAVIGGLGEAVGHVSPDRTTPGDLASLVDALRARVSPLVLVVDDLHLLGHGAASALVQELLLRVPPHIHLLVGSRSAPPFNLARTELSHLDVGADELRFRTAETSALFRDVFGAALSAQDSARLTRRTDGWAAALQLFHLSTAGMPDWDQHAAIRSLDERSRYASGYLRQQVLGPLPPALVAFLRTTSVLEALTARSCDTLRGSGDSHRTLLELERYGTLVTSADGGTTFRVHPVLRDHLATELHDQLGDTATGAAYRSAATTHLAEDRPAAACRAFARARAWSQVRAVMARVGRAVLEDRDVDWVDTVPEAEVEAEPWLRLTRAARSARDGDLASARAQAEAAARSADGDARDLATTLAWFARTWSSGDTQPADGWSEHVRATMRNPRRDASYGDRVADPHRALLRAIAQAVAGDLVGARRSLEACAHAFHDDPPAAMTWGLLGILLVDTTPAAADAFGDHAERLGLPWFARVADGVADARRQLAAHAVQPSLARRVLDAEQRGDMWGAAFLSALDALVRLRTGRPETAGFDRLASRFRALDAPALEAWALSGLALAAAAAQLPDAARAAESAEGFARSAGVPGAVATAYGAHALAQPEPAPELLRLAEADVEKCGLGVRPWDWIDAALPSEPGHTDTAATPRDAPLEVRCFGRFDIRIGGEAPPLARARPRAREALRLLALHAGHPVHREVLIDALWRGLDLAAATHNLHVTVSSLRGILEPGTTRGASQLLVRDGDRYTLALPPSSYCDLHAFDAACARAEMSRVAGDQGAAVQALDQAVSLYVGEVLPEDGPAEWVIGTRDRFRVRAADAAATLAELRLRHDPRAAAAAALRSIDIDPCRDGSWRLLLAAYDAAGDPAAAEQARRSYVEVLSSLGVVSSSVSAVLPAPRRGA